MRHPDRPVESDERICVDGEVVILAGDLDRVGLQVLDRMVRSVVTERQLDRAGTERQAKQLVSQADPEHGHAANKLSDCIGGVGHCRGVARTVRQKHTVRIPGEHVGGRRRCRYNLDAAKPSEVANDRGLDPEVVCHNQPLAVADGIRLRRRDG